MTNWSVFTGSGNPTLDVPGSDPAPLPAPPPWRQFGHDAAAGPSEPQEPPEPPGDTAEDLPFAALDGDATWMVNAAVILRRPLLITGLPGSGKSTIAKLVARELGLGAVLRWSITTSSRLNEGLYQFDAIGWMQDQRATREAIIAEEPGPDKDIERARRIGRYLRLGPLGTALLPWSRPRVLLIDEIDKADLDLPNDLLHVFEEGEFQIPELFRLNDDVREEVRVYTNDRTSTQIGQRTVRDGIVRCGEFPIVLMTSNGERMFPPAFLRRCLSLELRPPTGPRLREIVQSRFGSVRASAEHVNDLVDHFERQVREKKSTAVDQLLNAVFMVARPEVSDTDRDDVRKRLMAELGS